MTNLIPKLWASLPLLLLIAAMVVGTIWAYRIWQETHEDDGDDWEGSPEGLLEQFREAHAAGELDDAEFQRVCERLKQPGERTRSAGALLDRDPNAPGGPMKAGDSEPAGGERSSPPDQPAPDAEPAP